MTEMRPATLYDIYFKGRCGSLIVHAIVSTLGCQRPTQSPSRLPCQKRTPYKVRAGFSKPAPAARVRIGPPWPFDSQA